MFRSFPVLSVFCLLFIPVSGWAGTILVTADYPTIGEAMENANIGDRILVSGGTYNENVVLKAGVRLLGSSPTGTIIQAVNSATPTVLLSSYPDPASGSLRIGVVSFR